MTNVFGSATPEGINVTTDAGPIQLGHAFVAAAPAVITDVRLYVSSADLATSTGGSVAFYVWKSGDADSRTSGTLTVPAAVGWITAALSTPLQVPARRPFGVALDFGAGSHKNGEVANALPAGGGLLTCTGSRFEFASSDLPVDLSEWATGGQFSRYSYLIDCEADLNELSKLSPANVTVGDRIYVSRNTAGDVVSVDPVTGGYEAVVTVAGGPLDGEDITVWLPASDADLSAADMRLFKEVEEPALYSLWRTPDDAVFAYRGSSVYVCIGAGSVWPEGARTSRADTPDLIPYP